MHKWPQYTVYRCVRVDLLGRIVLVMFADYLSVLVQCVQRVWIQYSSLLYTIPWYCALPRQSAHDCAHILYIPTQFWLGPYMR
jgi:hypothetical protein